MLPVAATGDCVVVCGGFVCYCCLAALFCWLVIGAWLPVFSVSGSGCGASLLVVWCLVLLVSFGVLCGVVSLVLQM